MPTAADYEAAGLYDPRAAQASDRLALLEWLSGLGVSLEQMAAAGQDALVGLAADLLVRPGDRLGLAEVAALAGMTPEQVESVRVVSGLPPVDPDDPIFTREDAESFTSFFVGAALFGEGPTRHFGRVIGSSLARIAEAAVALFQVNVEAPIREAHGSELALAQAQLRAMRALEVIPATMRALLRAHLETAIRRSRRARTTGAPGAVRIAVGFVDLVGFTPLARQLPAADLAAVVERFESLASDVVARRDGRVVKLVGDAVMFVTPEAAAACDIALTLVERFADDPAVTPRGGLALGDALMRGGDYYGPVVNLAARIGDLAVPHEILVTREVVDAAAAFAFAPAGKRLLKGVDEPVPLWAAERRPDAAGGRHGGER
jgi:adenylate cyclase